MRRALLARLNCVRIESYEGRGAIRAVSRGLKTMGDFRNTLYIS
jgi:hypothetical protein